MNFKYVNNIPVERQLIILITPDNLIVRMMLTT